MYIYIYIYIVVMDAPVVTNCYLFNINRCFSLSIDFAKRYIEIAI